jgi:hypothetical protein
MQLAAALHALHYDDDDVADCWDIGPLHCAAKPFRVALYSQYAVWG